MSLNVRNSPRSLAPSPRHTSNNQPTTRLECAYGCKSRQAFVNTLLDYLSACRDRSFQTFLKNGFGDLHGEFWLGNDNLHRVTVAGNVSLRVDQEDLEGNIRYTEYATFKVADQIDKYCILIGGYSGTGDGLNKQRYNKQ